MRMIAVSPWMLPCVISAFGMLRAVAAPDCPAFPPGTKPVAHIVTVQGRWHLSKYPDNELRPGCQLEPGAEILPPPKFATGRAKLAVLDASGNLKVETCQANQECGPSMKLPSALPARPGLLASVIEELMRKLRGSPDKYVSAVGMDFGELNDALIVQKDSRVDLSPVVKGLTPGDLPLNFTRLVTVHWDATAAPLDTGRLSVGLYRVRREDQNSSEAWVLILPSGSAADAAVKKETELRTVMKIWDKNVENADTEGRNAARTVYRAFLSSQADGIDGVHQ